MGRIGDGDMSLLELSKYCGELGAAVLTDEPLKSRCTFKIGGPAALFIEAKDESEIKKILKAAARFKARVFVLGNGSNVLFSDEGFDGLVLHIWEGLHTIRLIGEDTVEAGSGASLKSLCVFAAEHGLSGLEFAYGIPGSVGGAVCMNAGAYGGEMKDVLKSVRHLTMDGDMGGFKGEALDLSYRHSAYSKGGFVITSAVFKLKKGDKSEITAKMDDFMRRRREKQPLDIPSAGSTFKRPATGYASALIDECGLKGRTVGGAKVSEKHAGFIVNTGGATCLDVLGLIDVIKAEVMRKKGVELSCEVKVVGAC